MHQVARWSRTRLLWPGFLGGMAAMLLAGCSVPLPNESTPSTPSDRPVRAEERWHRVDDWDVHYGEQSRATLDEVVEASRQSLQIAYTFPEKAHGYVELSRAVPANTDLEATPLTFALKAKGQGSLEVKVTDGGGSVFGRRIPLEGRFETWTPFVLDPTSVEYWWGGDGEFGEMKSLAFAPAGHGSGTVWLAEVGFSAEKIPATLPPSGPQLDPARELEGIGIRQRRDAELIPIDPAVLEWMKYVQDTSTTDQRLLGTLEDDQLQTFNNALAATAFMVVDERERAERILDFFASAIDPGNPDPHRQNFFYNGEARGFFQNAHAEEHDGELRYVADERSDRWMGDMAWLMFAFLHHDKKYGPGKYDQVEDLIMDLLMAWYKESEDGAEAYVQHGWRKGDAYLHEPHGHPEGNIDCYALFNLLGREKEAKQVRAWLDGQLHGVGLPLDLYTWRVLAYGPEAAEQLNVPDYDLRYRKTMLFNGQEVVGVYHSANEWVHNIWVDGVGHMACAYFAVGDPLRGNFYANQLDRMMVDRPLGGRALKALPYVLNGEGGFEHMAIGSGSVSPTAWYVFAKHRFNPMTLETSD